MKGLEGIEGPIGQQHQYTINKPTRAIWSNLHYCWISLIGKNENRWWNTDNLESVCSNFKPYLSPSHS